MVSTTVTCYTSNFSRTPRIFLYIFDGWHSGFTVRKIFIFFNTLRFKMHQLCNKTPQKPCTWFELYITLNEQLSNALDFIRACNTFSCGFWCHKVFKQWYRIWSGRLRIWYSRARAQGRPTDGRSQQL